MNCGPHDDESEGLDPMVQWERQHLNRPVFINQFRLLHFQRNMVDLEFHSFAEGAHEEVQHRTEGHRSIDIELRRTTEHAHGGEQAEKAEQMVSMDMGNAYMLDLKEGKSGLPHAHLRTLTTVYHKQAPMYI